MQVFIRRFRNEKRTEAETHPAVVSGIVLETPLSAIGQFFSPVPIVTDPEVFAKVNSVQFVSLSFLKWWIEMYRPLSRGSNFVSGDFNSFVSPRSVRENEASRA